MRGADERGLLNWKLVSCADHLTDEMTDTGADDADCDIRDYGSHHQARRGTLTLGHLHRQICNVDGGNVPGLAAKREPNTGKARTIASIQPDFCHP